MANRSWAEIAHLLVERGLFAPTEDGPLVFDDDLIAMVRRRVEEQADPPVSPDEVEAAMREHLARVRGSGRR